MSLSPYRTIKWSVQPNTAGFMPEDDSVNEVSAALVASFLRRYYTVLSNKPAAWNEMVVGLEAQSAVALLPL